MNKFLCIWVLTFLSSVSSERTWYPIPQTRSCTGAGVSGFCKDCSIQTLCSSTGVPQPDKTCDTDTYCVEAGGFSGCTASASDCSCPGTSETVEKPDPYDETKYFICNGDQRLNTECIGEDVYDHAAQDCITEFTGDCTGLTGPFPEVLDNNCESYILCSDGTGGPDTQATFTCANGKVYDPFTEECQALKPFSCPSTNGYYVNSGDCSSYFLCVDGEIFSSELKCDADNIFVHYDQDTNTCSDNNLVCAGKVVEDCGLCKDSSTRIKIDCFRYYQCEKNPDSTDVDMPFIPILRNCPAAFPFDEATSTCAPLDQVPECQ